MLGRFSAGTRCGAAIPEFETALVTLTSMTALAHKVTSSPPACTAHLGISPAVFFVEMPPKTFSTPAGTFSDAIRRSVCAGHLPPCGRSSPSALVGRYTTPFPTPRPEFDTTALGDVNHTVHPAVQGRTNFRLTPSTLGFPPPAGRLSPPVHVRAVAGRRPRNHDKAPTRHG